MSATPTTTISSITPTKSLYVRAGALALLLGSLQFFIVHLLVERMWPEPYSWARNNISDLGAVGCGPWEGNGRYVCSPLHSLMNASFITQGLLLMLGLVLIVSVWRRFLPKTALVFVLLASIGWVLVGIAPGDVDENLHFLGAVLIFFCGNLGLILAGGSNEKHGVRILRTYARPLGVIGLIATVLFLGQVYAIFGMGGMERFAVFPLQIWAAWTGVRLWRMRAQETIQTHA